VASAALGLLALPARAAELPVFPLSESPTASSPPPPVRNEREVCTRLFFNHGHGARTGHPPSYPPSPPASLAFISSAPSLSPTRPPSPATTKCHRRAMGTERSGSRPPREFLLSASPAPSSITLSRAVPGRPALPGHAGTSGSLGLYHTSDLSLVRGVLHSKGVLGVARRKPARSRPDAGVPVRSVQHTHGHLSVSWFDAAPRS
jgi:hypothetical protein